MTELTVQQVEGALTAYVDPYLNKTLSASGALADVQVDNKRVSYSRMP